MLLLLLHDARIVFDYPMHMVRNSLNYVGWNKRKEVAADLRLVYSAATIDEAEHALADFEDKWNNAYPPIALSWRNNWQRIIPFFDFPLHDLLTTQNHICLYAAIQLASKNRSSSPRLTGCLASKLSKSSPSTNSTRRIWACCLAVPLKR